MYLEHYGLDELPFRITPHTDFFFDGADRGTTLEALLYAIQHDEGIVKVSGEVGSGKTMLCRVLMERLPENVETIYLANPSLTRDEILLAIADDLRLETTADSSRVLLRQLQEHLIESYASGRRVVILIDEAHAMPEDSLEQVRLLSNLETSRHKLLQLVLFGQPELDQMLAATSMRQLRDRITHSFRMRPLTEDEIARYVSFRLRAAGYRGPDLFTPKAIALLTRGSAGLTRRVNVLADKALLSAFAVDTHAVDEKHVQRAIADAELPPLAKAKRPLAYVATALVVGAILGFSLQWALTDLNSEVAQREVTLSPPLQPSAPVAKVAKPQPQPAVPQEPTAAPPAETAAAKPAPPIPPSAPPMALPVEPARAPAPTIAPAASRVPMEAAAAAPRPDAANAPPATKPVAELAEHLRPEQLRRIDAYATGGQPLLVERIAATRELLQRTPDAAYSVELYVTVNTEPVRVEGFLRRARDLVPPSTVYVIPLTNGKPVRVWVVYGVFGTRAEAEDAAQRLPPKYKNAFSTAVRDFAALRRPI
jgi:type II secretory pathway predicted ATPase ExeA